MADSSGNPQLEVNIGGDISQLQASIIAAENELRGFQAEIKKTTDTGRIAELSKSIENTKQKIAGMRQEMGKSAGASNQAVNALGNVSRVAQDASYGFMGIANNLNPLFESFQRLQKDAGGTGNALKQMGAALTGPAGIGLAIGVVSSLIISFGDDIQKFITEKVGNLGEAFKLESDLITKGGDAYVKASTDINELKNSYSDFQNGFITKESFLKKFNATLGDTIKETNDLATAEKFLGDYADEYVQMTFKKAVANEAAAAAAKKQFEAEVAKNKPQAAFAEAFDFTTVFFGGTTQSIKNVSKARQNTFITEAQNDVKIFESIRDKYDQEADKMQGVLAKIFGVPTGGKGKDTDPMKEYMSQQKYELQRQLTDIENQRKKFAKLDLKPMLDVFDPKKAAEEEKYKRYFEKRYKENLEQSNKTGLGDLLEKDSQKRIAAYKIEEKQLKELQQSQEDFANSVADFGANAFKTLFTTLENGGDILESISNMFKQLAIDIAAAAIRAAIFEAIMASIDAASGGGASAAKGGGSILKSIFGFADGGIVTKPTLGLIGEAGQNEAIIPLSKLNSFMKTSFNAGSMAGSGGGNGGGGVAVLRGQDLLVAINRTQRASALKGQNISLL